MATRTLVFKTQIDSGNVYTSVVMTNADLVTSPRIEEIEKNYIYKYTNRNKLKITENIKYNIQIKLSVRSLLQFY